MKGMTIPSVTGSGSATGTQAANPNAFNLGPSDFLNMMITELQNQDPTKPTSSSDLLGQMSQIGQLQSATSLQTSLQSMVLQNSISSAGNLIGKSVQGMDDQNNTVSGLVTSVRVENKQVKLELDSGNSLQLGNVTSVSPGPTAAAGTRN
jgi:flagellar basal-body rod modification protein FlgD